jgi:hypothetical protein
MGLLDGILGAVLAGGQQSSAPAQRQSAPQSGSAADPLDGLLGAILGGNPSVQQRAQQQGVSIDDILASIAGGGGQTAAPQLPSAPQSQGGMGDILGSILGGAMGGQPQQQQMPSAGQGGLGPLGSILGAVIGGGAAGGGDLKSIGISVAANAFLAPIVNKIAAKLGLPPSVAQAIVAFAVQKLVLGAAQQRAQPSAGSAVQPQAGTAPNINDILQSLGQGQRVDRRTIKQLGLADELAANTDIDPSTAARGLQAVFDEFSGPMTTTEQPDYSSLLQKWVPS